jgi:hypothetical protein
MFATRVIFVFALLALALLALPDRAQAGCWDGCCSNWSEYKAACACQGGTARSNPLRCESGGGGYSAPAPVDPRVLQLQRWQLLLQKNLVDAATYGALPVGTDAEFVVALTRLYDELYRNTALWHAEATQFSVRSDVVDAMHKDFYAPRFARIDASDDLDREVSAANRAAKAKLAELQAELTRRMELRDRFVNGEQSAGGRSDRLHNERAIATRRRLAHFFGGFTPDEVKSTTGASSGSHNRPDCCEESTFVASTYWEGEQPGVPFELILATSNAAAAVEAARNAPAPTLSGDAEARLQAIEQQAVKAEAERKTFIQWRDYSKFNVEEHTAESDKRTWAGTVKKNVGVLRETFMLTHNDIKKLEGQVKWHKDMFDGSAWEFYMNGAATAAWTFFEKHVVEPEIKRIAIEVHYPDNYSLTDAEIESAWKLDTHALFGAYDIYKKGQDAASLIEQAKKLANTAQDGMLAVADVMGRADMGDYKEVGDELFGNLDSAAREEVRESLGQVELPWAFKKFWEGYFTGVKPTFEP